MTDNEPESMTNNDEIPDDVAQAETFDKEERHRLGQRGDEHIGHTREQTDLDGMTKVEDVTVTSYCKCGEPVLTVENTYRCCGCDAMCCSNCRLKLTRYNYCPQCARQEYAVDKQTYLTLYLLDKEEMEPADLVTTETVDTELEAVTIDPAATTLLEHSYIQTDDTTIDQERPALAAAVDEEEPLTTAGKEALHVGEMLYGDDPDVEALEDELTMKQVTNR
jgi:hypothetical protein